MTSVEPRKVRDIDHDGKYYSVHGCHICEPSPQRTPVLFQAELANLADQLDAIEADLAERGGESEPSLERRLQARGSDSAEVVARRMAAAAAEIEHWSEYDYVLVNSDLDESLGGLQAILAAERLKRERQTGMADFVAGVLAGL